MSDYRDVPQILKDQPSWVCWRFEKRDGRETKILYNALTGKPAKSNDPATWTTFERAVDAAAVLNRNDYDGVGCVIAPPFAGIDLDKCRNPESGEVEPWAQDAIAELNSYTELSPSGTGFHIWVKGTLPPNGRRAGHVEMYSDDRYFTITGEHFSGTPKTVNERELTAFHKRYILDRSTAAPSKTRDTSPSAKEFRIVCEIWRRLGATAKYEDVKLEFFKTASHREKWEKNREYVARTVNAAREKVFGDSNIEVNIKFDEVGEKPPDIIGPSWVEPMREDAFYGLAGEFVRRVEPETEADRHALLANFLVMAGVQFGRNAFAVADGKKHYPNEFVLLVGESGAGGRKGTATERTLPIFHRVDEHFYDHILSGLSTGEGLIKATEPQPYEDVSLCRSYLGVLSEYASLLGVMKREGNTMSAVLRNAWDTAKLTVLTRKDPLKVDNVNLSLVAHITPPELLNTLSATERANGFANRHLILAVRRSKILPEGGNDVDANDIVCGLRRAVIASRERQEWDGKVSRNAEAKALWAQIYSHLTRTRAGLSGALLSRAEAHVLRLSLLYALLDSAREIRVEHLKAALAFWDYCEASVGQIFGSSSGDPLGDKILSFMDESPEGFALPTDISVGVFHRNKEADWIRAKMDELTRRGKIVVAARQSAKGELNGWKRVR